MRVIKLLMKQADVEPEMIDAIGQFVDEQVASNYTPLLAATLAFQAEKLRVAADALEPASADQAARYAATPLAFAEVFPTEAGVVALQVVSSETRAYLSDDVVPAPSDEDHHVLNLFGIGVDEISEHFQAISQMLEERFGLTLTDSRYKSQKFERMKSEGREPPAEPSVEEARSAAVLSDSATRKAAIAVASSGGLLVADLPKQLGDDAARADEIHRTMLDDGLVDTELVVTCSRKSTQVARAPSRDKLRAMADAGLRCACGKNVIDERVDEALTLTEHGRRMLDGSYWMTILVLRELQELGVPVDRMMIEQTEGGDEMDFFADVNGELALFELKDKEFSINSAYSFGSKIGIVQPDHPVIVTSAYVGNDAKDHFERSALARRRARYVESGEAGEVRYVEGIASLRPELEKLVAGIYESDAVQILRRVLPHSAPSPASVVAGLKAAHLDQRGEEAEGAPPLAVPAMHAGAENGNEVAGRS